MVPRLMKITILGSTGSVGANTLDVVARNPGYEIHALAANRRVEEMERQCRQFKPAYSVMADERAAQDLRQRLADSPTTVLGGAEALSQVAADDAVDAVMAAIVGGAGLTPTLAAVRAGKRVLLANKESLVMSGRLFMTAVAGSGATLLPIDSEHNAVFQCLANGAPAHAGGVRRILLTASGGPLLRKPLAEFAAVTPAEACAHPNWDMGRKISVDSASMMNKGLEVIEASLLFDCAPAMIDVVIHPQSVVHSMVEYLDGSVVAQMGNPDMRTPIAHGLAWPERIESGVKPLDLCQVTEWGFEPMDDARFPCLGLAREAAEAGQSQCIVLNAANEVAVQGFLDELIGFHEIPLMVAAVLGETSLCEVNTIEEILDADRDARVRAFRWIDQRAR
jgi:1-deoxy-D-xylulose-5-phosphate reductoisomerase